MGLPRVLTMAGSGQASRPNDENPHFLSLDTYFPPEFILSIKTIARCMKQRITRDHSTFFVDNHYFF